LKGENMGRGIIGALIGGLVGALLWGGISAVTGYEIGIVAWALGGMVGGGALLMGGGGKSLAIACGLIAALSIIGGKLATSVFVLGSALESEIRSELESNFTPALHSELNEDARAFLQLSGEHEYARFMVEREFTIEPVLPAEIEEFKVHWVPLLRRWGVSPKPYPEARKEYVEIRLPTSLAAVRTEVGHVDVLKESFGLLDIVFFGLGIFTAYGMVARREEELQPQVPYPQHYPLPPQPGMQPQGQPQMPPAPRPANPPPPPWEQPRQ
jgi:hypothetical protein